MFETISNSNILHIKLHLLETEDYSLKKDFSYSKNTTKQNTHTNKKEEREISNKAKQI